LSHHNSPQSLLRYSEIIPDNKELYSVSNITNLIKIGLQLYDRRIISMSLYRA